MVTCKKCSAEVAQIINRATAQPVLVDLNPDAALGVMKVDWATRMGVVLDLDGRASAIRSGEELYVNHISTCTGADRDRSSYAEQVERQIG